MASRTPRARGQLTAWLVVIVALLVFVAVAQVDDDAASSLRTTDFVSNVQLDQALAVHDLPVLIEAVIDPYEPPMPPNVTLEQAAHFAESLVRGEPNRKKIALTVVEDKVREMV